MKKLGILFGFALLLTSCNLPRPSAPTPFTFPTPDLTLTAIYAPLETQLAITPPIPTATLPPGEFTPTPTLISVITSVPATATSTSPAPTQPSPTQVPPTRTSPPPTAVPATQVPEALIRAEYLDDEPDIDGNLDEWVSEGIPVRQVVFGEERRQNNADLSGRLYAGWTEDFLWLGGSVRDDTYVQEATGSGIWEGDSLEILLDKDLTGDEGDRSLSRDDYQLGISPGSPSPGDDPEAYLWYPRREEGEVNDIDWAFVETDEGYDFEMAIPWSVFGVGVDGGERFGFAFSLSDNDREDATVQQSMVSNVNTRYLPDPTTWGVLRLVRP